MTWYVYVMHLNCLLDMEGEPGRWLDLQSRRSTGRLVLETVVKTITCSMGPDVFPYEDHAGGGGKRDEDESLGNSSISILREERSLATGALKDLAL